MLTGIDHLVVAVDHLDGAASEVERRLGLSVSGGGRHERLGTANRLAWLGDAYLELLAVEDRDLAATSWVGRPALEALARGGGLATYALASDDLAADLEQLRAGGAVLEGPVPGERRRPDGETVRWWLGVPERLGPDLAPFLIEHEAAGVEWGPGAREERRRLVHPFGGRARLAGLELAVADPDAVALAYRDRLGVALAAQPDGARGRSVGVEPTIGTIRVVRAGAGVAAATILIEMSAGSARDVDLLGCRFRLAVPGYRAAPG